MCVCVVLFLKVKKKDQTNDNWNFWIWFLGSQNGRFVTHNCFSKVCSLKPLFSLFWGCARFGPSCQKKGNFGHPPKNENID